MVSLEEEHELSSIYENFEDVSARNAASRLSVEDFKVPAAAPETKLMRLVVVSFGLLCVLQAALNISLRLSFYSYGRGMQEFEGEDLKRKLSTLDWVEVANDLLSKCAINLRLRKLTDCDANVFIALYENILGEKVPDYIAAPCSQEDEAHNVQSVIDSLSLDYLQISLSHITGENVVRGDKDSTENLLEIFDGLLEYLKEEISEESQNGEELNDSLNEDVPVEAIEPTSCDAPAQKETKLEGASLSSSGE
ncbi:hypothetical protein JOQ06_028279 [Pogonophryne albipinna]|uniref:DUF5745 domain-containing protein n=1 Tax=Pogonophryne albipinna TaxID=1090488 RepID=A0AAD6B9N3_9TELE|nr:hypothetical protein JOQ06_028279 [Pogonophryne albipinna]